mmetsp:Transcript_73/g.147  ORF Transcript_73/g.147 Transcript_73/m.147 type:complete len:288 (-) Transcript_73:1107-1970(-)
MRLRAVCARSLYAWNCAEVSPSRAARSSRSLSSCRCTASSSCACKSCRGCGHPPSKDEPSATHLCATRSSTQRYAPAPVPSRSSSEAMRFEPFFASGALTPWSNAKHHSKIFPSCEGTPMRATILNLFARSLALSSAVRRASLSCDTALTFCSSSLSFLSRSVLACSLASASVLTSSSSFRSASVAAPFSRSLPLACDNADELSLYRVSSALLRASVSLKAAACAALASRAAVSSGTLAVSASISLLLEMLSACNLPCASRYCCRTFSRSSRTAAASLVALSARCMD